jgi:uncharacterized membrane protein YdbT with pleckstrin-like domain
VRYVDEVLQPGETVLFFGTIHWVIYLPGLALSLIGIVGMAGAAGQPVLYLLFLLCLGVGLAWLFRAWFQRWTTEIAVTDRRIIFKRGFIRRFTIEMNMEKVESVDVDQSVLGRLLDYGDVIVRGTGTGFEPLHMIGAPIQLRNAVTAK